MRPARILLAALIGTAAVLPSPARAQVATTCINCSTIVEQLEQYATEAKSLATQLDARVTQLRQYANQIQNTIALPTSVWSQVQSDILQVRSLTNAASLLSGNAGGIVSRLNTAGSYATQAASLPDNLSAQFAMWQTTMGNASSSLGRTLGLQASQQQNNAALQAAIQLHSQTAAGQMQAIQAGVEMGAMTNTQLQQIQVTLHAAAQEQANKDDIDHEREALADALSVQLNSATPFALGGNPRY